MASSESDRRRRPRPRLGSVCVLAGVVLSLSIARVAVNWSYRSRVDAKLRQLKADGHPITGADLAPPPVPGYENAAPLYLKAADIVEPPGARAASLPQPPDAYTNVDWRNVDELPELAAYVKRLEPALELMRDAAERPAFRFDVDWDDPVNATFPHFSKLRKLGRLAGAGAIATAYQGNQGEALGRMRLGATVTRSVERDNMLVAMLVGAAVDSLALRPAPYVVGRGRLPEAEARRLADELLRVDYEDWYPRAMDAERVFGIAAFRYFKRHTISSLSEPTNPKRDGTWWVYARLMPAWLYADETCYLTAMEELDRRAQMPLRDIRAAGQPLPAALSQPPRWAPATNVLLPVFSNGMANAEVAAARRGLPATALGAEVFRQRKSHYPDSLEELRGIGWPDTEDPFSGKAFVYRGAGEHYQLYSLGVDCTDDGGKPATTRDDVPSGQGVGIVWGVDIRK